jgi:hypothetical protein
MARKKDQEESQEFREWLHEQKRHSPRIIVKLPDRAIKMMADAHLKERSNLSAQDTEIYKQLDELNGLLDRALLIDKKHDLRGFRIFLQTHFPGNSVASLKITDHVFKELIFQDVYFIDELRVWAQAHQADSEPSGTTEAQAADSENPDKSAQVSSQVLQFVLKALSDFDDLLSNLSK